MDEFIEIKMVAALDREIKMLIIIIVLHPLVFHFSAIPFTPFQGEERKVKSVLSSRQTN